VQKPEENRAAPQEAVGYIRVSTKMQANDGAGLQLQRQSIRDWCEVNRYRLTIIYQDVASAVGKGNLRHRPGLEQAVREALQKGVPLIVTDVSRASRDWTTLDKMIFEDGLRVISIKDGGEVPAGILHERVGQAAEQARRTAEGTREALSKVAKVKPLGAKTGHRKAARASAAVRIDKKFQVLERVVDYLAQDPSLLNATSREIAEHLNREGIYTGWDQPWTASAVRGKLDAIKKELEFRRLNEAEEEAETNEQLGQVQSDASSSESLPLREKDAPAGPTDPQTDPDDEDAMKKNPFYAMF